MSDGKKKRKKVTAEERQFRVALLRRIDDAFGNITDEELKNKLGTHRNTLANWRETKGSPSPWIVLQSAKLTNRRPAWLAFGELPEDPDTDHLLGLLATGLNRASEDTRRAALRVLGIEPDSLPSGIVIKVHQDASADSGRKITPEQIHRICQIVGDYIEKKTPLINSQESEDLRYVLSKLQQLVDGLSTPPTDRGRADAPNAGDAIKTDVPLNPPPKDEQDDEGATP